MATETLLESMLSRGGRLVEVLHLDAAGDPDTDSGPIWRCGCGAGSDWPLTTGTDLIDPAALVTAAARGHAELCTR